MMPFRFVIMLLFSGDSVRVMIRLENAAAYERTA